jgi:hypothetical protein
MTMGGTRLRTALGAAAGLALLLVTTVAGAHHGRSAGRGSCVVVVNQAKAACFAGCIDTARNDFAACFGSGSGCVQTCLAARLSCEAGPVRAIHACVGDSRNPDSCRSVFKAAVAACRNDPNPEACSDEAKLNALKCRQACVDAHALDIDTCRDAFRMCLHGCPGSPSGAFLDAPQV